MVFGTRFLNEKVFSFEYLGMTGHQGYHTTTILTTLTQWELRRSLHRVSYSRGAHLQVVISFLFGLTRPTKTIVTNNQTYL